MKKELPDKNDFEGWRLHIAAKIREARGLLGEEQAHCEAMRDYELRVFSALVHHEKLRDEGIHPAPETYDWTLEKELNSSYRAVAQYVHDVTLEALELHDEAAEKHFKNLQYFLSRLAKRNESKWEKPKVSIGKILYTYLEQDEWPKRSFITKRFLKISTSTLGDALEFYGVQDFVRDNQKG